MGVGKKSTTTGRRQGGQTAIAVESLGARIVGGSYPADQPLPVEQDLADELKVSRNSLREAIKVLSGKGMVAAYPRRGTFVRPVTDWNLFDHQILDWHLSNSDLSFEMMEHISEMRRVIEPNAARLAARRASKEDIARITSAYQGMEDNIDNPEAFIGADVEFHRAVLSATHNVILCQFQNAVTVLLEANFAHLIDDQTFQQNTVKHRDLAFAIAGGDEDGAFNISLGLLDKTDYLIRKLRSSSKG